MTVTAAPPGLTAATGIVDAAQLGTSDVLRRLGLGAVALLVLGLSAQMALDRRRRGSEVSVNV